MKLLKNLFCIIGVLTVLFLAWVFLSPEEEVNADSMYEDEYFEEYVEPYQLL